MCKPIAGHSWWITILAGLIISTGGWIYAGGKKSQEVNEISRRMSQCENKLEKIDETAGRIDRSVSKLEALVEHMERDAVKK